MLKVQENGNPVWINPAHIVWFWDWHDECHVALTNREEMMKIDGMTSAQFAQMIEGPQIVGSDTHLSRARDARQASHEGKSAEDGAY